MAVVRSMNSTSLYEAAMQAGTSKTGGISKIEDHQRQYWIEAVEQSLEWHHWLLGPDTCRLIAKDMQAAHDNYGMNFPGPGGY